MIEGREGGYGKSDRRPALYFLTDIPTARGKTITPDALKALGAERLAGALQVCMHAEKGAKVLGMLPDAGERYLSTPPFEDIPTDMTAEETEIFEADGAACSAWSGREIQSFQDPRELGVAPKRLKEGLDT